MSLEDEERLIEQDATESFSLWKIVTVVGRSIVKWAWKRRRKEDGESAKPSEADD